MVFGLFKGKRKKAKRAVKRTVKKKVKRKKTARKAKRKGGKRKAFGGYQIKPDANFAKIVGNKPITPAQMTKKVWQYIKRKNLGKK
jgi:chromatin remodeling complex protein RSC6